ncbi:MAG: phosphoribosylaminoimidazolesuccinocarboxamide synthase [Actinobacteria bacterium]|nr:phosphoribosylaminoimidazolesuccinocarboxamide synthase [Actinomycetota bacterium]
MSSGKVRDIYDVGDGMLLMVASDRISAFDVVMSEPIADKGRILTAMTCFWLQVLSDISPNHLITGLPEDIAEVLGPIPVSAAVIEGRAMLVKRAEMLPLEFIVRGYLAGSAWREYAACGSVHSVPLRKGLRQSERLDEPMFTVSTKAISGHDENVDLGRAAGLVGAGVLEEAKRICMRCYERAARLAEDRGILVADTKFELGWIDGELCLCDEVLTPDSSRFWPIEGWAVGSAPPSLDKQPLRDWLEATGWDKQPPPPALPREVVEATRDRYLLAYERLALMASEAP